MSEARFTVYGRPAPKGSRTPGLRKNDSVYTRPASSHEIGWVEEVAKAAKWMCGQVEKPEAPYSVDLRFYLAPPKKGKYPYPPTPDLDKLARAVIDGCVKGELLTDDRHVTEILTTKAYAPTTGGSCCQVTVRTHWP